MDLNPYLENLRRDLEASAAPGGDDVRRAADLLAGSLEAATRLSLLEALSDAAAEITTKLEHTSVEVRLRGRAADFVVSDATPAAPPPTPPAADAEAGDVARITLRLPEQLKGAVERAATAEGISVNAWLVRAIGSAVHGSVSPGTGSRARFGRRVTGFAQA
ncbi:MAG: toxin-antitoxin system HicB family antitoxin [Actinocatenispora sp.]